MPAAVTYTNFGGMLVHENRGGVETEYVNDTLGSLVECRDTSGTKTYEATYWPYGEIRTSTGTNPSPWAFVGLLGYLRETSSRTYVRARYYRQEIARWMTVDPLWPDEDAFLYGRGSPQVFVDPSGMFNVACVGCGLCLGAALLAALLGCLGDPRGMGDCVLDWLERNPWALAVIAACLVVCAACLGPAIARLVRGLIRPRPKPSLGGGRAELPRPQPGAGGPSGGPGRTGGGGRPLPVPAPRPTPEPSSPGCRPTICALSCAASCLYIEVWVKPPPPSHIEYLDCYRRCYSACTTGLGRALVTPI